MLWYWRYRKHKQLNKTYKMNHLEKQITVLNLRRAAKQSDTESFLHTSAGTNAKLILGFLQSNYKQSFYMPTPLIVEFMNQTTVNVLRLLHNLERGGFVKKAVIKGRGICYGWNCRP